MIGLGDFLTDAQIAEAIRLHALHDDLAVEQIRVRVIEPNMVTINAKLGQDNDPQYLAYAVVYAITLAQEQQLS